MIYWQYILIFAVFFYAGWNLFRLLRRIRRDHFQKMAVRKLLKRSRIERGRMYFNSDVLRRTIAFLLGCRSQSARRALLNMACGKTAPAEAFLRRRGHETDALLLETLSAAEPDKRLSPVETAVFRLFAGDKDAAEKIIRAFRVVPTLSREVFKISQRLLFHAFPHLKILLPQGVCMLSEAAKIEKFWMVLEWTSPSPWRRTPHIGWPISLPENLRNPPWPGTSRTLTGSYQPWVVTNSPT